MDHSPDINPKINASAQLIKMNNSGFGESSVNNLTHITGNPERLRVKEEEIKTLKSQVKAYAKVNKDQTKKLVNQDKLFVEYNSLNKNFSELQNELLESRAENIHLKEILAKKNEMISSFQVMFEDSKTKFEQYDRKNAGLILRIKELESKLNLMPNLAENNTDLCKKINEMEDVIAGLKNENNKKEELYKAKLNTQEKMYKINTKNYDEEIKDMKIENEKLKKIIEELTYKNEEANKNIRQSEDNYQKQLKQKEKDVEKLTKSLNKLKIDLNENHLTSKSKEGQQKEAYNKLTDEIKALNELLQTRDDQINQLNQAFSQFDITIKQSEGELKSREATINGLLEDKEVLLKQLNDRQLDFVEYQQSSKRENETLRKKISVLEEEKLNLAQSLEEKNNQLNNISDELSQYQNNDMIHFEECKEADRKYNELAKAFQIKEQEYSNETQNLAEINKNLQCEMEIMRAKYDKKVQVLQLNNNELNMRVKNLISSLISLKDYALSIERNLNDNNYVHSTVYGGPVPNNLYSELNGDPLEFNIIHSEKRDRNKYSRDLLAGMKNMLNQIDSKILKNQDLNQTY